VNREALLSEPPVLFGAVCCRCGRWSCAAVELRGFGPGSVRFACPDCVLIVASTRR